MGIIFNRPPLTPEQIKTKEERRARIKIFMWVSLGVIVFALVVALAVCWKFKLLGF